MTDLVVWAGPVANFQVRGATVQDAKELFLGCCGDLTPPCKPPTCPTIGNTLMGSPSSLLTKAGVSAGELDGLYLGAYSAGGSVHGRLVKNPEYRKLITALLLSDATYTAQWVNKAKRIPPPITSYVDYAADVISGPGDKLFIATASPNPNGQWATGIENLRATAAEIEKRTGGMFEEYDLQTDPMPDKAYRLGNVIFAEYGKDVGHGEHATVLAPQIWPEILQRWIDKGKGPIDVPGGVEPPPVPKPLPLPVEPSPSFVDWLLVGAVAALTFWSVTRAAKRK